jgi:hypothetical protein
MKKTKKKLTLDQHTLRSLSPLDLTEADGGTYGHGHSYHYCSAGCPSQTCNTVCGGGSCGTCWCP